MFFIFNRHNSGGAFALPPNSHAKHLDMQIKYDSLDILHVLSNCKILLKGQLRDKIRTNELTWSTESNFLLVTLEKSQKTWWDQAIVKHDMNCGTNEIDGSQMIDTDLLVDKAHEISEYNMATQGMIRKTIFDEDQQKKGLPSMQSLVGSFRNSLQFTY